MAIYVNVPYICIPVLVDIVHHVVDDGNVPTNVSDGSPDDNTVSDVVRNDYYLM